MLSIGRLGVGQEGYYLGKVASGAEDYYLGSGEAAGRWTGVGASAFGVSGEVSPEQLRCVLASTPRRVSNGPDPGPPSAQGSLAST